MNSRRLWRHSVRRLSAIRDQSVGGLSVQRTWTSPPSSILYRSLVVLQRMIGTENRYRKSLPVLDINTGTSTATATGTGFYYWYRRHSQYRSIMHAETLHPTGGEALCLRLRRQYEVGLGMLSIISPHSRF